MIMYNLFDIFMVMYLGNEIKLASHRLSSCLFESKWIEQSQETKKHVVIVTEMIKCPKELIVGKLYPLNLQTFVWVSESFVIEDHCSVFLKERKFSDC